MISEKIEQLVSVIYLIQRLKQEAKQVNITKRSTQIDGLHMHQLYGLRHKLLLERPPCPFCSSSSIIKGLMWSFSFSLFRDGGGRYNKSYLLVAQYWESSKVGKYYKIVVWPYTTGFESQLYCRHVGRGPWHPGRLTCYHALGKSCNIYGLFQPADSFSAYLLACQPISLSLYLHASLLIYPFGFEGKAGLQEAILQAVWTLKPTEHWAYCLTTHEITHLKPPSHPLPHPISHPVYFTYRNFLKSLSHPITCFSTCSPAHSLTHYWVIYPDPTLVTH